MRSKIVVLAVVMGVFVVNGCQSAPQRTLLAAPAGANVAAVRHNDEGIQAYQLGQWESARQHFEAAIKASPGLAEAHYNLGMVFYKMGKEGEANAHFMKAADLAPGNEVIWSSPPLSTVQMPSKSKGSQGPSDGHGHSH